MKGDFAVPTLFNGNFDVAITENKQLSRSPVFSNAIPGWSFHNGELSDFSATIDNLVERSDIPNLNSFDRSGTQPDFALHLNPSQNNSITHNRFLIPDSGSLHLDVFVPELKVETEGERNRLLLQTGNYIDISLDVDGQQYNLNSIAEPFVPTPDDDGDYSQPIEVDLNTDVAVDLRPSYLDMPPERLGDKVLRVQENLNRIGYGSIGFETFVVDVPSEVRGKSGLLTIEVKGDKSVYLDDVFFSSKHTQSGIPTLDKFEPRKEAIGHENNYLIEKPQYVVSYNNEVKNANWVSFQLNQSWLSGKKKRPDNFAMDLTLPDEFAPHPVTEDYRGGWAQGHLTAATDRTRTEKDYMATFILSNINPQYQTVNEGIWNKFEEYLQEQANLEKDVHIITGSYGEQEQISDKEIRVPKYFWKVALILNKPGLNLAEIQAEDIENVIAVRMPNTREDLPQETTTWQDWTRTVEFIEDQTNLIFFNRLPNQLASNLKKYEVKFKNKKGEKPNPKSFN
jgi:DNA/RNA endonuclease G (NUC1)